MTDLIERVLGSFESGQISRREAVGRLAVLALGALTPNKRANAAQSGSSTFKATGLNHLGLRVSDVASSRDFYKEHLGLTIISDNVPYNCFMACGEQYVGLFRSQREGLDHYAYTIEGYEPNKVQQKLEEVGIDSTRQENRIYFKDPDGLTTQVCGQWDSWPGPLPEGR